jgi:flagellar protein FliO/FliZ
MISRIFKILMAAVLAGTLFSPRPGAEVAEDPVPALREEEYLPPKTGQDNLAEPDREELAESGGSLLPDPDFGHQLPRLWSLRDTLISLLFLLCLGVLLLLAVWARKFALNAGRLGDDIRIVARQAIDSRNSLIIVQVRGRDFLLGVSAEQVNLLTMVPGKSPSLKPGQGHLDGADIISEQHENTGIPQTDPGGSDV